MTSWQRQQLPARPAPVRRWIRGALALVTLGAVCAAAAPPAPPDAPTPPPDVVAVNRTEVAVDNSAMDEPLRFLAMARASFERITDYKCTLVKKERINGEMTPDQVVAMSVRNEPFSVDLRWLKPDDMKGQEACYVAGRNSGKMRVKSAGLLGALGFLTIDPNDPRAQKTSKHAITEAGIGNLLERFAKRWESERPLNATQVRIGEYEYNHRRCDRVETLHPTKLDEQFLCYSTVLYFDRETHLPIRVEAYDWPQGNDGTGALIEVVNYINIHANVGLADEVFNH